MPAGPANDRCCARPEHLGFNTGEQQDAHQEHNARVELALEVGLPLVIAAVGLGLLALAVWG